MDNNNESPNLKTFVVITLPPPNNPSYGKTISTFTITDSSSSSLTTTQEQPHQPQQNPQFVQPPNPQQTPFSSRRFFQLGVPKKSFFVLGISLFALILWACSSTPLFRTSSINDQRFRNNDDNDDDDSKTSSFVFPLFSKFGRGEALVKDIELKLGRFVELDSGNVVTPLVDDGVRGSKVMKAVSEVDSTAILPVKGGIYPDGLYYTYILVGSPPRPYFLEIDTGSDLAWVQCDAPCTSCAKGAHPLYKPKKGNILPSEDSFCAEVQKTHGAGPCETCHQCDYEIEYADHSSSMGVLVRDYLHLKAANGSLAKLKVVFGCAYDQQGVFLNSLSKTDGILGLSRSKLSLPSQLASQGIINNVVGHCLTADAGGGGYMFLGDDFVPHRQMNWVQMLNLPSMSSYVAEASKISYGKKQLRLYALENGHVVFDSGSSYTYFTKQAYVDLVAALKDVSASGLIQDASDTTLPICWKATVPVRSVQEVSQFFKPLTFQFRRNWFLSMKLRIPPEGYLIVNNKGNVCLGILDGSEVNDGSTIILGDVSMRGQLIVYDNVNQYIGWMQSECVKPKTLNLPPSL